MPESKAPKRQYMIAKVEKDSNGKTFLDLCFDTERKARAKTKYSSKELRPPEERVYNDIIYDHVLFTWPEEDEVARYFNGKHVRRRKPPKT